MSTHKPEQKTIPDLDLAFVRSNFPALSEGSLGDRVFLENAGGSLTCKPVIDRLTRFYLTRKMQPYWDYAPSSSGGAEMDEARALLAALLGVDDDELSFGPSTTQNTYVLARAFSEWLDEGDAIIVTNQDHEANSGPWRRLADKGIEIREWGLDPTTGHLSLEVLETLLDDRVKLVCFPHCSNVIGEINDVAAIADCAHASGAFVCVDGVSYAPHGLPDVSALGADIYLFSSYKTYGPHQGIMVVRRKLAEQLPNQGHHFNASDLTKKFTPAGPDHAQVAACAGIADYFDALYDHHFSGEAAPVSRASAVHDLMRRHEIELTGPLLAYLAGNNSVQLLGTDDPNRRAPTLAIKSRKDGLTLHRQLAERGILAGGGDFYGVRPLQAMGLDVDHGVLRVSMVHYNSQSDVERLVEALDEVLAL